MNTGQLDKDIKEAEEALFGNRGDHPADGAPTEEGKSAQPDVTVAATETLTQPVLPTDLEKAEATTLAKKDEVATTKAVDVDVQKRFNNYKASTDASLFKLRKEVSRLSMENVRLVNESISLKQTVATSAPAEDMFKGVVTKEQQEILGDEGIETLKNLVMIATTKMVDPIKEELADARAAESKRAVDAAANLAVDNQASFLEKLGTLVPDLDALDFDPEFHQWMAGIDTISGFKRMDLFKQSESGGDVGRVAQFFDDYRATKTATKVVPELENSITPTQTAASETKTTNTPKIYTMAEVNQYYADVNKGEKYKNNPRAQLADEAAIDLAFSQGRIRG